MKSFHKTTCVFLFVILSSTFLSTIAFTQTIEVKWPQGVDSPPKTMAIFAEGPCILLQKIWVKPFKHNVLAAITWNNHSNTIPPFPCGPGVCGGRIWENNVQVDSFGDVKDGSAVHAVAFFKIKKGQYFKGTCFVNPPQIRNWTGGFVNQFAQNFKVTFETISLDADPFGNGENGDPLPPEAPNFVDETKWKVGSHPVPWIFHKNGTVEAPNLWKGTWSKANDTYIVTLTHQGNTDNFEIKFSSDGKTFTAYKNGKVYREGSRLN